jgi:hypothetical protein
VLIKRAQREARRGTSVAALPIHSMNGTVSVRAYGVSTRVLKPSRLFVQLGNNSRKNRQAAFLNDD